MTREYVGMKDNYTLHIHHVCWTVCS